MTLYCICVIVYIMKKAGANILTAAVLMAGCTAGAPETTPAPQGAAVVETPPQPQTPLDQLSLQYGDVFAHIGPFAVESCPPGDETLSDNESVVGIHAGSVDYDNDTGKPYVEIRNNDEFGRVQVYNIGEAAVAFCGPAIADHGAYDGPGEGVDVVIQVPKHCEVLDDKYDGKQIPPDCLYSPHLLDNEPAAPGKYELDLGPDIPVEPQSPSISA